MDSSSNSKLNIPDVSARNFSAPATYQARKLKSTNISQKHVSETAASLKSLSSRALEVKLAEARLERVRRDEELRLRNTYSCSRNELFFNPKLLSKRPILLPMLPRVAVVCPCQRILLPFVCTRQSS